MFQNRMPRAFFILWNHLQIFISLSVKRKKEKSLIPILYGVLNKIHRKKRRGDQHFFLRGGESIYASCFKQIPLCKSFS